MKKILSLSALCLLVCAVVATAGMEFSKRPEKPKASLSPSDRASAQAAVTNVVALCSSAKGTKELQEAVIRLAAVVQTILDKLQEE